MKYYAIAVYYPEDTEIFEFDTKEELEQELKSNLAITYVFYGHCLKK